MYNVHCSPLVVVMRITYNNPPPPTKKEIKINSNKCVWKLHVKTMFQYNVTATPENIDEA